MFVAESRSELGSTERIEQRLVSIEQTLKRLTANGSSRDLQPNAATDTEATVPEEQQDLGKLHGDLQTHLRQIQSVVTAQLAAHAPSDPLATEQSKKDSPTDEAGTSSLAATARKDAIRNVQQSLDALHMNAEVLFSELRRLQPQ